jgi:peptide/nickel transport system permease protein
VFSVFRDLIRYNIEFAIGVVLVGSSSLCPPELRLAGRPDPDLHRHPGPAAELAILVRHQFARPGHVLAADLCLSQHAGFGITVAVLSRIISIVVGLAAGYLGGWVDRVLMFVNDIFVAIPIFPILILFYFVMRNN